MRARGMCGMHVAASWLKRRYLLYLVAILCLGTLIIFQNKSHALVKSTPMGSLISAYSTGIILQELEVAAFETPHFEHALSMTPSQLSKGAEKLTSWPAKTQTSRWKGRRMQYYCRFLRQWRSKTTNTLAIVSYNSKDCMATSTRADSIAESLRQSSRPPADPLCPLYKEEPQTIEHWLRRCPRLDATRQNIFGSPSPLLKVLSTELERVLALARVTLG